MLRCEALGQRLISFGTKQLARGWGFEKNEEKIMTIRSLSQANSDPSNSPRPEQPTEIPDIPPAIVPEQQPDVLPEPLGPDIPDRPDPAPDVPMPEQMPPPPDSPGQPALS